MKVMQSANVTIWLWCRQKSPHSRRNGEGQSN